MPVFVVLDINIVVIDAVFPPQYAERAVHKQVGHHAVDAERVVGGGGKPCSPPFPSRKGGKGKIPYLLALKTEGVHHPLGHGLADAVFWPRHHPITHLQFVYRRPAFFRFYQSALDKAAHAGG